MKLSKIMIFALSSALLLSGCAKEEIAGGGMADEKNVIRFTLGGAVAVTKSTVTRANGDNDQKTETEAEEAEKSISSVHAVLYENGSFYKTIKAESDGADGYYIPVEDVSTFDMWLVANASDEQVTALEAIPEGTAEDDATNGLTAIVASQAPDEDNKFLMLSTESTEITTKIGQSTDAGEIHMQRLSVRIDILNAVDGVRINKITFNNRVVKSYLNTANVMPTEAEWYENKEYTLNLEGNKNNPAIYKHEIYTYENYSQKGAKSLPSLMIEYTENGETKVHTVFFHDAKSADKNAPDPLALKRNYLYRIKLVDDLTVPFELDVVDWNLAENFEVPDLEAD